MAINPAHYNNEHFLKWPKKVFLENISQKKIKPMGLKGASHLSNEKVDIVQRTLILNGTDALSIKQLKSGNRINKLLRMELKLPEFTEVDVNNATKKLLKLINKIVLELSLNRNKKLPILEKIQLAYEVIAKQGYIFLTQENSTFVNNMLNNKLDCDTSSFILMTLADELKDTDKVWADLALIKIPKHVFVEINGQYIDFGRVTDKQFYLENYEMMEEFDDYTPIRGNDVFFLFYDNRGTAYLESGKYELASKDFDVSLSIKADGCFALAKQAFAYLKLGKFDAAIDNTNKILDINPSYYYAKFYRGIAYASIKYYDFAISNYSEVIDKDPEFEDAYYFRGIAYYESGFYDFAIEDFSELLLFNPDNAEAFFYRALCYSFMGNEELAISDLEIAKKINPQVEDFYLKK